MAVLDDVSQKRCLLQLKNTVIFFLFLQGNILWHSLEAHWRGASNEYQQHMFSWKNKKTIM